MGTRDSSELFSLAMQFVASLAWAVAALLEGLSSHIDALYFIAGRTAPQLFRDRARDGLADAVVEGTSLPGTDEALIITYRRSRENFVNNRSGPPRPPRRYRPWLGARTSNAPHHRPLVRQ